MQDGDRVEGLLRLWYWAAVLLMRLWYWAAVLLLLAIVTRQLLRQGWRLVLHLAAGGEAPPGTPGV